MIPPSVQEKSLPLCNPVEHMSTNEKEKETLASLVTKLSPINVKPQGRGGGRQTQGNLTLSREPESNSHPKVLLFTQNRL